MDITENFKRIIDDDIATCNAIAEGKANVDLGDFHSRLLSKYANIIDGFIDNLLYTSYDSDGKRKRANIETMKQKLELFKAMGYCNMSNQLIPTTSVNVNNFNENNLSIHVEFDTVRKTIENMSSLPESEIEEALSKISELESIVKSKEKKTKKWDQAKEIIKWVADKGVDIGIAFLPLLMQIQ